MPRPSRAERAAKYVAAMPAAISGSGGHNATFAAACVLLKGFDLSIADARPIMKEFNERCNPQWSEPELEHKLTSANNSPDDKPRGYLLGNEDDYTPKKGDGRKYNPPPKPKFDPERLRSFAGDWAETVDQVWLANRSAVDPADLSSADFLELMYGSQEKVLFFTNEMSQGDGFWPEDEPPRSGKCGVWILPQPVDGEYHPNPRTQKKSRRSEESITAFRWMILESDDAPLKDWLGAVAQLPLRIGAMYTSGSRSVHALVQLDAMTKKRWDAIKDEMAPGLRFLITNGADKGVLRAVQLSRLPGAYREGKYRKDGSYEKFPRPVMQKLLYVNPRPEARPLVDLFPKRDVVKVWCDLASNGKSDNGDDEWIEDGLRFYANKNERIRHALENYNAG